jgi:GTP-dependent phosphoenolpyruvate carboxykinase
MTNQIPSRFITYPDTVKTCNNHTVTLIDADLDDVANLATFCTFSKKDYDIYLYKGTSDDLRWLSWVCDQSSKIFIRQGSQVTVTGADYYDNIDNLKQYFTKIDSLAIDQN